MKRKDSCRTLLFFVLYAALIFALPQYAVCSIVDPDDDPDLFGKSRKSADFSIILASPELHSLLETFSIQCRWSEDLYLLAFDALLVSSVTLRC